MLVPIVVAGALVWLVSRAGWGTPLARELHVTGRYGGARRHKGVDLRASVGTPVLAVADGRVEWAGWDSKGGGNVVRLRLRDGTSAHYAHLSEFSARAHAGEPVYKGDVLGYSGNSGASNAPHLHFAWKGPTGVPRNPTGKLGV